MTSSFRALEKALAISTGLSLSDAETANEERLARLAARLRDNRFQLAVLGQFKRGKSTLLNTLLKTSVLPTGAIPLTAVTTFITYDERPQVNIAFVDRATLKSGSDVNEIASILGELATEEGNPHNMKGVERIDVALPAGILRDGLVLIDTPGIGSVELHNSETAVATLPECDAALFVLSPDPPITEAELGYLAAVQRQAALIVPVLTKADTIGGEDLDKVRRYLVGVLARAGVTEPIIAVSARAPMIGIDRLEARISAIVGDTRRELLERAIVGKAIDILDDLAFQNETSLAALRLPIAHLDDKIVAFREAANVIGHEHEAALDLTSGDRRRLLDQLDEEAIEVRSRAKAELAAPSTDPQTADRNDMFAALSQRSSALFEEAYRNTAALVDEHLIGVADRARRRIASILTEIREAASEIIGIPFRTPEPEIEIETPKLLAWVERQQESMSPLPTGFLDRFLPEAVRSRRQRKWFVREVDRLVTLNTENLRWTLRQQVEEILRRFDATLRDQLANAETAITDLLIRARDVRARSASETQTEVDIRERRRQELDNNLMELRRYMPDDRTT